MQCNSSKTFLEHNLAPDDTLRTMFDGDPTEGSGYSITERLNLTLLLANKSEYILITLIPHWNLQFEGVDFRPIPRSIKATSWKQTRACSLSVLDKRPYFVPAWKYRNSTTFELKTICCSVFGGPWKWVIYIINEWVDNNGVFYSATDVYGFQGFPL